MSQNPALADTVSVPPTVRGTGDLLPNACFVSVHMETQDESHRKCRHLPATVGVACGIPGAVPAHPDPQPRRPPRGPAPSSLGRWYDCPGLGFW